MRTALLSISLFITFLCSGQTARVDLVPWATGLSAAVDIAHCGDTRLFVARQNGLISIVTDSITVTPTPFLDLTDDVLWVGEQGLLGLAFDPDYTSNGFFYVNYISTEGGLHSRISRFTVSTDPNVADPASEQIIYMADQPFSNHNGGDLEFGPDGYLYIAFGDGGGQGDPEGHAQDLSDPLGDIVRIDVSDAELAYAVPPDNPYLGQPGILPEIWASGLRNPYRFGFDAGTGDLWIGDVGQGDWEEIDRIPGGSNGGENFGWRCYEGFAPYNTSDCAAEESYEAPLAVQFNGGDGWCAIIGGRVYRGSQWPNLEGHYIYTDFCLGEFWSMYETSPGVFVNQPVLTENAIDGWSAIVQDVSGELFVSNLIDGTLFKIIDACPMGRPTITFDGSTLTSSPGNSYQWFLNGLPLSSATEQSYTPVADGDFSVLVDLGDGCQLMSDAITVLATDLAELGVDLPSIMSNPANDNVTITSPQISALRTVRVLDLQGREVLPRTTLVGTLTTLNTTALSDGQYVVQFMDREGEDSYRLRLTVSH